MARSPNGPCPCASGRKFKRCCLRLHQGAPAPDPEALMRSRWSAYAVGAVDYIIETTDPEGPQFRPDREIWAEEIRRFCASTRFEKLELREVGLVFGDRGEVEFFARLSRAGEDVSFCERSEFVRRAGRWFYVDGAHRPEATDPAT